MSSDTNQALENMAYTLGVQAYIWGFPIVISEHSRLAMGSSEEIIPPQIAGAAEHPGFGQSAADARF